MTIRLDYSLTTLMIYSWITRNVLRSVVRYRDLASYKPFRTYMKYPISAALTLRGCHTTASLAVALPLLPQYP